MIVATGGPAGRMRRASRAVGFGHAPTVRTTLDIDDDVLAAARELAARERRSLGAVISQLARRGLTRAPVDSGDDIPVIRVPSGTPAITPEMVRRALHQD